MEYRRQYAPTLAPMPNLGPSIQSLGPMSSLHMPNVGPNDCHRQPYDKVYEDWLKYKNALPLNTSGLVSNVCVFFFNLRIICFPMCFYFT